MFEQRLLLSAIAWTGNGDGTSWGDVSNWLFDGMYTAEVTITDTDGNNIFSKKTKFNVTGWKTAKSGGETRFSSQVLHP